MNLNYQELIPANFHDSSRVWIYQGSRPFSSDEAEAAEAMLKDFASGWKSHGAPVKGFARLLFGQFIILMADESATAVGGCSTDTSVHLVQAIEQKFKTEMFNRQSLAFVINENIRVLPLGQLDDAVENNLIDAGTLYFNNTVLTKKELLEKWLIPVKDSWLAKRVSFPEKVS